MDIEIKMLKKRKEGIWESSEGYPLVCHPRLLQEVVLPRGIGEVFAVFTRQPNSCSFAITESGYIAASELVDRYSNIVYASAIHTIQAMWHDGYRYVHIEYEERTK